MRDDSLLNTGMTSASARKVQEVKQKASEKKIEERNNVVPNADVVLEIIAKEKASIPNKVWALTNSETSEESVRAILAGLRLYDEHLDNLSNQLQNVLRKA